MNKDSTIILLREKKEYNKRKDLTFKKEDSYW